MKIGIGTLLTEQAIDIAVLAKRAEELGFESIWVPEQNIQPVETGRPVPRLWADIVDPYVALSRASAVTSKIKLGTSVTVVPEFNPLGLAKQVATLDMYSAGRIILGIGVGSVPEQASIYGTDYPRRWTQAKEMVAAMQALWTQEESEFHGDYYDFPPVFCFPKPSQKPHPPILLVGSSPRILPRVLEWAEGWIPIDVTPEEVAEARRSLNTMADRTGRDPASINITVVGVEWTNQNTDILDILTRFEQCGADRVVISVDHAEEIESLAQLETIAMGLRTLDNGWVQQDSPV